MVTEEVGEEELMEDCHVLEWVVVEEGPWEHQGYAWHGILHLSSSLQLQDPKPEREPSKIHHSELPAHRREMKEEEEEEEEEETIGFDSQTMIHSPRNSRHKQ